MCPYIYHMLPMMHCELWYGERIETVYKHA